MRCLNCNRTLPKNAKACVYCEALVEEPSAEEMEMARAVIEQLSPEALAELERVMMNSDTAEEFVNQIFVGPCPKCQSAQTGDCEDDQEIGDLLVGRCYECGQLWCTECGKLLTLQNTTCACWDEVPEELQNEEDVDEDA